MDLAPILIFTYKRLGPLKLTIEALQKNRLSSGCDLYIFSDGAKEEKDKDQIQNVREYLSTISYFKSVTIKESSVNKGLANSIIDGVTEVLRFSDSVIVLEDDLLTTPNFLSYMNSALERYQALKNVFSISGYSFDLGEDINEPNNAYFLKRGWSWGWATWRDRWQDVDWNVSDYNEFSKSGAKRKAFAKGGSDLNSMLKKQMSGQLDSWAIRWFYHQYKINGLTLYPVKSKVYNNGFDAMATHTNGAGRRYWPSLDTEHRSTFNFPDKVYINDLYNKRFMRKMGLTSRIRSRLESFFKKS
jgi:hypothetical protein